MGTKVLIPLLLLAFVLGLSPAALAQDEDAPAVSRKAFLYFRGNTAFDDKQLLKASGVVLPKSHILKQKRAISADEAEEIVNELTIFYKREGYFDISVKMEETGGNFEVVIFEGPIYRISGISLSLETEGEAASAVLAGVKEKLLMKDGEPFKVADYDAAQPAIEKAFGEAGFPFVKAVPAAEVDVAAKTVRVKIVVSPGITPFSVRYRSRG
jgi:outer membrane protein assembly factor BamA